MFWQAMPNRLALLIWNEALEKEIGKRYLSTESLKSSLNAQTWHEVPYRWCCMKYRPCKFIVLSVVLINCTGNTLPGRKKQLKLWESGDKDDPLLLSHAVPVCFDTSFHMYYPLLTPLKEYKRVWHPITHQKQHLGICYVILPFFFFSNQTRLHLAKPYD